MTTRPSRGVAPVCILSTGIYAPGAPIDNTELMRLTGISFDAQRLETKIGIHQRHIARLRGASESTADFAEKAARQALSAAGVDARDVGLFVVATDTPEYISPATAIILQGRLQAAETDAGAFDVGASCASFVTALDTVSRVMMTDASIRYALVVGVYNMPAYLRPGDEFGWTIFADGAGAVVLGRDPEASERGYVEGVLKADGTQWDYVGVYAGGTRKPVTTELLETGKWGLELLQRLPGDRNVKLWPPIVHRLLAKAGWSLDKVDHFFFTQINKSVIKQVMDSLGLPFEKTTCVMDRYGYTGSACIPMALHTALAEGTVKKGDMVVLVASGAGLAVGANLIRL